MTKYSPYLSSPCGSLRSSEDRRDQTEPIRMIMHVHAWEVHRAALWFRFPSAYNEKVRCGPAQKLNLVEFGIADARKRLSRGNPDVHRTEGAHVSG